ncbi:MAG: mechanosensitive ion channel family protein [Bdellovibrio sp. CG10_big_fil_rev_8_21_14_0_10_47_8]|nr:MAG: mechanosensitive ion channel family protein [Bdellovibrio sp. CG10_big_fil_rev_8_21_14_0_10_47_8]
MGEKFINTKNLYAFLDYEPFIILTALVALAWIFYKVFLKEVSAERHRNLSKHFKNLARHFSVLATLFATFVILRQGTGDSVFMRALPYIGICTLFMGMMVFVKTCRLIALQYLFLGSMKHGVPILMVNILSLILSLILVFWGAASIFGFEVTPLLATSAAFSIILGLALQDTLGNLFAGISLQLDKCFDIGDWIEITSGGQKTVGQVKEISWRATVLTGWTDELITLPNRFLANSQIANFSLGEQPILRSQIFRLKPDTNIALAKQCLLESLKEIRTIRAWPEPLVLTSEMTDSWVSLKLLYYIENYGSQFTIADTIIESALNFLKANGMEPAPTRIQVLKD